MVLPAAPPKKVPLAPLIIGAVAVLLLIAALFYLNRPVPKPAETGPASPEAKAYVHNLELSDVTMKAAENFMKQQVVEIQGKIANKGPRPLQSVDVYCLFYGIDGREVHRERVPIVQSKGAPLKPGEIRPFRLPFDTLPDGWNQAMPRMVIARMAFAR
jgi:hypothetical protein